MKKILGALFVLIVLFSGLSGKASAQSVDVALTIRDADTIVFSGNVPIEGDTNVLSVLEDADESSNDFEISNIQEFPFGKYLKCITYVAGERCDNWQYVVDGTSPFTSVDQTTISGGENIYVYFGPQNRIILGSSSITTNDSATLTAEKYDYENNDWVPRTEGTVGLTQPNPSDPWSPIEVMTMELDGIGQATFINIPIGSYNVGIREDYYFPTEPLMVTAFVPSTIGSSGSKTTQTTGAVLGASTEKIFDLKKAFEFIIAQQKEDGSFGEEIYTDWVAVSLASSAHSEQIIKLIKYLAQSNTEGTLVTDHERRAIALMSLGLNPYNTNGENYIKKITDSFDGKQFGDINEDNDDIFALLVLQNAGFDVEEKNMASSIEFVLGRQKENGSWDESVDMTGAGIQALANFTENEKVRAALGKAKEFLQKSQKDDGGFGNVSSTAWAVGGIIALKEKPEDWQKGKDKKIPFDYMAVNQDTDGAMKNGVTEEEQKIKNKIWETAYATVAYSGKTWNDIMQNFEKPKDFGSVLGESLDKKTEEPKLAPKKITQKLAPKVPVELKLENIAPETTPTIEEPKLENKNWFMKFINFIF